MTLSNKSAGGELRGTVACDTGSSLSLTPFPSVAGANVTTILSGYNPAGCSSAPVAVITNQSQTEANPSTSSSGNYTVGTSAVATPQHQLTVSTTGQRHRDEQPAGINCGADCSQSYNQGTVVTLTPTPAAGWAFTGWGGACSGTGSCQVTMDAAKSVSATFTQQSFALNVSKSGNGTVTSNPAGIDCGVDCSETYPGGTPVTLSAVADAGWRFAGWSGEGCSGTGTCQVSMTAVRNVTATFVRQFQLSVAKTGTGAGTVTSSPAGISCGGDCGQLYDEGTTVTLTAAPSSGSSFAGWSGEGCSGTASCVVTMSAAKSVTASFTQNPPGTFALTVARNGNGTVTSSPAGINCGNDCSQVYNDGTSVTLSATADPGWSFSGWSGAGCAGTAGCVVTANAAVTATFTQNPPPQTSLRHPTPDRT